MSFSHLARAVVGDLPAPLGAHYLAEWSFVRLEPQVVQGAAGTEREHGVVLRQEHAVELRIGGGKIVRPLRQPRQVLKQQQSNTGRRREALGQGGHEIAGNGCVCGGAGAVCSYLGIYAGHLAYRAARSYPSSRQKKGSTHMKLMHTKAPASATSSRRCTALGLLPACCGLHTRVSPGLLPVLRRGRRALLHLHRWRTKSGLLSLMAG